MSIHAAAARPFGQTALSGFPNSAGLVPVVIHTCGLSASHTSASWERLRTCRANVAGRKGQIRIRTSTGPTVGWRPDGPPRTFAAVAGTYRLSPLPMYSGEYRRAKTPADLSGRRSVGCAAGRAVGEWPGGTRTVKRVCRLPRTPEYRLQTAASAMVPYRDTLSADRKPESPSPPSANQPA